MSKAPPISSKNTKNEILTAYSNAIERTEKLQKESRQQAQLIEKNKKLVESASQRTPQEAEQCITALRCNIDDKLRDIAESMSKEIQHLKDIQEAASLEEISLTKLYNINKTAHTLDTLLLAHQEEKKTFDTMMEGKRSAWEAEQSQCMQKLKEEQHQARKAWKREQEEYDYKLKITREKDSDSYAKQKAEQIVELKKKRDELTFEFAEREAHLKETEIELASLRKQVSGLPSELKASIKQAEQAITERLNREHKFTFDLLASERKAEVQLSAQKIESLESKLVSQDKLLQQLSDKVNHSVNQVKDIAFKAIDGSSQRTHYPVNASRKEAVLEEVN